MTSRIASLSEITDQYDVLLCDVWGVLHNGVTPFISSAAALAKARQAGLTVVLITNAPRLNDAVADQLDMIGVDREAYDRIVTSGDVTRKLIAHIGKPVYFLGPDRDLTLLEGLEITRVDAEGAEAVVCTGFFDDETETPEDYRDMLQGFAARDLPLICANPDIVVERGEKLIPCAGAIAALYNQLGGKTRIAGKPFQPIYHAALAEAQALRGEFAHDRVLAIGDGMPTDVKGAVDQGLDLLYVSAGIHGKEYMTGGQTDEIALEKFLGNHAVDPRWWIARLA